MIGASRFRNPAPVPKTSPPWQLHPRYPILHPAHLIAARRPPCVARNHVFAYAEAMEVHFAPDVQAKLDRLVSETGRAPDKLLEDALAGYDIELAETREMLDSRYDDLKSGRVKPIPGEEIVTHFREKSAAARRLQPNS
jgi:hypothetical protein